MWEIHFYETAVVFTMTNESNSTGSDPVGGAFYENLTITLIIYKLRAYI